MMYTEYPQCTVKPLYGVKTRPCMWSVYRCVCVVFFRGSWTLCVCGWGEDTIVFRWWDLNLEKRWETWTIYDVQDVLYCHVSGRTCRTILGSLFARNSTSPVYLAASFNARQSQHPIHSLRVLKRSLASQTSTGPAVCFQVLRFVHMLPVFSLSMFSSSSASSSESCTLKSSRNDVLPSSYS